MAYKFQIGTSYVSGNIELQPDYDLLVDKDGVSDLGTSAKRFANAYVDSYYGDGSNLTGISSDSVDVTGSATDGALMLVGAQTASASGVPLAVPTSDGSTNPSNALLTFKPSTGLLSGSGQIQANSLSLNGAAAISNQGAVSGVTTLAMGGALSGVTTVGASGLASLDGGIDVNGNVTVSTAGAIAGVTTLSGSGQLTYNNVSFGDGNFTVSAAGVVDAPAVTVDSLDVSSGGITGAGAIAGVSTLAASGLMSVASISMDDGSTLGPDSVADLVTFSADGDITIKDGAYDFNIAAHDGTNGLALAGTVVGASANELNYNQGVTAGTAIANATVVLNASKDVTGINGLTASYFYGDGSNITGLSSDSVDVTGSALDGALMLVMSQTASASGAALAVATSDGSTNPSNATLTFHPADGQLSASGEIVGNRLAVGNNAATISNQGAITAKTLQVEDGQTIGIDSDADLFTLAAQAITIAADASLSYGGTAITSTGAELNLVDGSSAGTVVNSKAVIYGAAGQVNGTTVSGSGQVSGKNVVIQDGATIGPASVTDIMTFNADGDIVIKNGTYDFNIASHDGTNGLALGGTIVGASANEINYLQGVSAGTAATNAAVVLDGSKNIATIGTVGCGAITSTGASSFGSISGVGNVTSTGNLSGSGFANFGGDVVVGTGSYYYGDGSKLSNVSADLVDVTSSAANLSYELVFTQDLGTGVDLGGNASLQFNPTAHLMSTYRTLSVSGTAGQSILGDGLLYLQDDEGDDVVVITKGGGVQVGPDENASLGPDGTINGETYKIAGTTVINSSTTASFGALNIAGGEAISAGRIFKAASLTIAGTNFVDGSRNISNAGNISGSGTVSCGTLDGNTLSAGYTGEFSVSGLGAVGFANGGGIDVSDNITARSVDLSADSTMGGSLTFDKGSEQGIVSTAQNLTLRIADDKTGTNGSFLIWKSPGNDFMKFDTRYDVVEVKQDFSASCSNLYLGSGASAAVNVVGRLDIGSGVRYDSVAVKTTTATLDNQDSYVICQGGGSAFTVTLPASPTNGEFFAIKRASTMSADLTISGNGNNIDGQSTIILESAGAAVSVVYDSTGDQWNVF